MQIHVKHLELSLVLRALLDLGHVPNTQIYVALNFVLLISVLEQMLLQIIVLLLISYQVLLLSQISFQCYFRLVHGDILI